MKCEMVLTTRGKWMCAWCGYKSDHQEDRECLRTPNANNSPSACPTCARQAAIRKRIDDLRKQQQKPGT
jgi:hypothetical protein